MHTLLNIVNIDLELFLDKDLVLPNWNIKRIQEILIACHLSKLNFYLISSAINCWKTPFYCFYLNKVYCWVENNNPCGGDFTYYLITCSIRFTCRIVHQQFVGFPLQTSIDALKFIHVDGRLLIKNVVLLTTSPRKLLGNPTPKAYISTLSVLIFIV